MTSCTFRAKPLLTPNRMDKPARPLHGRERPEVRLDHWGEVYRSRRSAPWAPSLISSDLETVVANLKNEQEGAGKHSTDPLGGLAAGLAGGLASLPAYEQANACTTEKCGCRPGTE